MKVYHNFKTIIFIFNLTCAYAQLEKPLMLNEVVIVKSKINAVDLGIIERIARPKYTKCERRLQEAKSGIFPLIINSLNGKIEMCKKEIIVEKKLDYLYKLKDLFDSDFYLCKLKIPLVYINSFQYYLIDNLYFCETLNENNKEIIRLKIIQLSFDFKKTNKL